MRYITTDGTNITFIDVDGSTTIVPMNSVYTYFKDDTVSFLLLRHLKSGGLCIFTTKAADLTLNGTVYTYSQLKDGNALDALYSSPGIRMEVVDELPDVDEAQDGVIYLVYDEDNQDYIEYIKVYDEENDEYFWEELGHTTDVDLTNYYDKDEVDAMIEETEHITAAALVDLDTSKQDVISDLETIRSGAALGATALQSYTETDPVFGASAAAGITSNDINNWNGLDAIIRDDEEVIAAAFNQLNASSYQIPSGGIPLTDLASSVQTSIGKADTAVQTETDPVFTASAAYGITSSDITNWNGKANASDVYTKTQVDTIIQNNELAIAAALNQLNNRVTVLEGYHTYHYVVQLVDGSNYYTLDEDVITEDIPQSTLFEISVTRFVGNSYSGENLQCGDFTITLESNNSPITVSSCQFTTANVDEQSYTLTIDVDGEILDYDFTLENTGL